jgi:hypothetical protein
VNRQIGCIVTLGVAALLVLGLLAGYGAKKNPRLFVKARVEREAPVVLLEYEPVPHEDPFKKALRVKVRPRDAAPATHAPPSLAGLAERVGIATVTAFKEPDAPYLDFARLIVDVEGAGASAEFERFELERRAARAAYERERAKRQAAPAPGREPPK